MINKVKKKQLTDDVQLQMFDRLFAGVEMLTN